MNFEYMPGLGFRYSYFIILAVMVTVAGGVAWWFWARRWLAAGRKRLERFVPTAVDPRDSSATWNIWQEGFICNTGPL
jgi:hypothetical protein